MSELPATPSDCGCCAGSAVETPVAVANRPGLQAIAYRVGTHARFKTTMLAELAARPELAALRTRRDDDFSIALLDAWATVADVLTFYQERIANESYLRTSTERLSILELARLIGYELRPGVAASTLLAFMLESAAGSPRVTTIDVGTRVQSVPQPGEEAQTFETTEAIEARVAWNAMRPRLTKPQRLAASATDLIFASISTALRPGDVVLFYDATSTAHLATVQAVALEPADLPVRTRVKLGTVLSGAEVDQFRGATPATTFTGRFGSQRSTSPITADALATRAEEAGFAVQDLFDTLAAFRATPASAYVFRARAGIFGHNAPRWSQLPTSLRADVKLFRKRLNGRGFDEDPSTPGPYAGREYDWVETSVGALGAYLDSTADDPIPPLPARDSLSIAFARRDETFATSNIGRWLREPSANVYLERVVADVGAGLPIVVRSGPRWAVALIDGAADVSVADFTLSGKVTRLHVPRASVLMGVHFPVRTTTVFLQVEALPLAREPITDPVGPGNPTPIELEGWIEGLAKGRAIIVAGEPVDAPGTWQAEPATIDVVEHVLDPETGGTRILLHSALSTTYRRDTVTISANVAHATHGETAGAPPTKEEVLGSGDATVSFQRFTLRQPPLTYVSAATATGTESTLEVRVDGIRWHEVPALLGRAASDRVFVSRRGDDGKTTVVFGDGVMGARLPTGVDNVRARYRKGIGRGGNLRAERLTQLLDRPLGVKSVTNPLAAKGGDDAETRDDARRNAALQVKTLDRLVSLRDYEDFARAFGGVAKALASWTWDGRRQGIVLTVAGPGGAPIAATDDVYRHLVDAIVAGGEEFVAVQVATFGRRPFGVRARLRIDPDHERERVLADARTALLAAFSFDAREFGQPVALSEVYAVLQGVPGVLTADVLELRANGDVAAPARPERLVAAVPRPGARAPVPAEILMIDPSTIDLSAVP